MNDELSVQDVKFESLTANKHCLESRRNQPCKHPLIIGRKINFDKFYSKLFRIEPCILIVLIRANSREHITPVLRG